MTTFGRRLGCLMRFWLPTPGGAAATQPSLRCSITVTRRTNIQSWLLFWRPGDLEALDFEALWLTWRCPQRGVYWGFKNITIVSFYGQGQWWACGQSYFLQRTRLFLNCKQGGRTIGNSAGMHCRTPIPRIPRTIKSQYFCDPEEL